VLYATWLATVRFAKDARCPPFECHQCHHCIDERCADLTEQALLAPYRCLYKAVKPFRTFMDSVVAGSQLPMEPPEEKPPEDDDDFVPQVLICQFTLP